MQKIVINKCYGGFSLSAFALEKLAECGINNNRDIERDNPYLVSLVETYGKLTYGSCAELKIIEIPDDVKWCIKEYDGLEHVAEMHRIWY